MVIIIGGLEITKWAHFSLKGIPREREILLMVTLLLSLSINYRFLIGKTICESDVYLQIFIFQENHL